MTATGLALGSLAMAADPAFRRPRLRPKDAAMGLASAAALYGMFQIGDRVARRIMPDGAGDISDIYQLGELRPKPELAARLGLIVGPAEELFWRGFVLRRLARLAGQPRATLLATAAYGGAHLLIGAATVAGLFWSALAAAGMPMAALIVSHVAWDIWIFLLAPSKPPT